MIKPPKTFRQHCNLLDYYQVDAPGFQPRISFDLGASRATGSVTTLCLITLQKLGCPLVMFLPDLSDHISVKGTGNSIQCIISLGLSNKTIFYFPKVVNWPVPQHIETLILPNAITLARLTPLKDLRTKATSMVQAVMKGSVTFPNLLADLLQQEFTY